MIRDNHGHAQLPGVLCLLQSRNPVIAGQDRIRSLASGQLHQMNIQAVPVLHPVRYLIIHPGSQAPQPPVENIGGIDPVNIIVPNDPDFFLLFYLF